MFEENVPTTVVVEERENLCFSNGVRLIYRSPTTTIATKNKMSLYPVVLEETTDGDEPKELVSPKT